MTTTEIRCHGVGLQLHGEAGSRYSVQDLAFTPQTPKAGTALTFDWSAAAIGKGFVIENVAFGSMVADPDNFFDRGLEIRTKGSGQVSGCWFNGKSSTDPQGEGLVLAGANDVIVSDTHMYNLAYACRSDGRTTLEGFKLQGSYLVRVGHGVYFEAKPVGLPYIEVALSHISACYEAVHLDGYSQANIVDNLIYARNDISVGDTQTDIWIRYCPELTIARNKFMSGMDKAKFSKTAIKTVGIVRNGSISENLASDRTVFLSITDDGKSGAQDLVVSKNRAAKDEQGKSTVTEMYQITQSPLHRRITWDGARDEFESSAILKSDFTVSPGQWVEMPFHLAQVGTAGLALQEKDPPGEFAIPAGITYAKVSARARIVMKGGSISVCGIRIIKENGSGSQEIARSTETGVNCTVAVEAEVSTLMMSDTIRVEVFHNAKDAGLVSSAPAETAFSFSPQ
ncbi:hypothetical protein AB6803_12890 [Rhizobium sp. RCC_161_2]